MPESDLYEPVAAFIKKEFACFHVDLTKGIQFGKIDVIGIRYVMGDLGGNHEVIAVEVKPERATFLKAAGQAYAYSVMADRCYLAIRKPYDRSFTQEEKDIAAKLGIGLIQIGAKKKCRVVVSSPEHSPTRAHKLKLIQKLGFVECVLCRTLFSNQGLRSHRQRSSIANAIDDEKGFRYWLYHMAEQRPTDDRKYYYDRRLICPDCVAAFDGLR